MKILLKNDDKRIKKTKLGFSFSTLFFGPFVPLLRADFLWMFFIIITYLVVGFIYDKIHFVLVNHLFSGLLLYLIINFIYAFIYNKKYVKNLVLNGFKGYTKEDEDILKQKNLKLAQEEIEEYKRNYDKKKKIRAEKRKAREERDKERRKKRKEEALAKKAKKEKKEI